MEKDQILAALEAEEARRRREAKKRGQEILALMEEQRQDLQGKLWGEQSFHDLPEARDAKRVDDVVARRIPDFRNPERIAIMRELWWIVSTTILGLFGETAWKLFREWIQGATVAELAEEKDMAFTALLRQIRAMVAACRRRVGSDPAIFPFRETGGKIARRVNVRRTVRRRMMEGKARPADEAGRVYLSDSERRVSLDPLLVALRAKGYQISRATAWRAKKTGWFYPSYDSRSSMGTRVELTAGDRALPAKKLAARYGVHPATVRRGKNRGWFYAPKPAAPTDDSGKESA